MNAHVGWAAGKPSTSEVFPRAGDCVGQGGCGKTHKTLVCAKPTTPPTCEHGGAIYLNADNAYHSHCKIVDAGYAENPTQHTLGGVRHLLRIRRNPACKAAGASGSQERLN